VSKINNLYTFLIQHDLLKHLDTLSSSLKFLNSTSKGFSKQQWYELTQQHIGEAKYLASPLFSILVEMDCLMTEEEKLYFVTEILEVKLNELKSFLVLNEELTLKDDSKLLWNVDYHLRSLLSTDLKSEFNDLTSYFKDIISSAQNRVILCAPYFSIAGILVLQNAINVALKNNKNMHLMFIIDAEDQITNQIFIQKIHEYIPLSNFSLYLPTEKVEDSLRFHSKFLLVDGIKGYLGSANFSKRATKGQFELGVKISPKDCEHLEILVEKWIELNYLTKLK